MPLQRGPARIANSTRILDGKVRGQRSERTRWLGTSPLLDMTPAYQAPRSVVTRWAGGSPCPPRPIDPEPHGRFARRVMIDSRAGKRARRHRGEHHELFTDTYSPSFVECHKRILHHRYC